MLLLLIYSYAADTHISMTSLCVHTFSVGRSQDACENTRERKVPEPSLCIIFSLKLTLTLTLTQTVLRLMKNMMWCTFQVGNSLHKIQQIGGNVINLFCTRAILQDSLLPNTKCTILNSSSTTKFSTKQHRSLIIVHCFQSISK